jgi:8-oxo-dGTP pyrophosphatase MutT (NUDIX family)
MTTRRRKWDIRTGRTVYDNRWINVREYEAIAPTGAPAQYGLVHMKRLALGVLPIDADGNTILVGQERFPFGRWSWELPEGGGSHDDPPVLSAQRELAEECNLKADNWHELFRDVHLSNSVTDETAWAYLAWDLSPDTSLPRDPSEDLEIMRVPFAEALRMAVSGEITDVFSLVMLLKADHLARTGALPAPAAKLLLARP